MRDSGSAATTSPRGRRDTTPGIHRGDDGLVVECTSYGVALTQRPAFDADVALGTFLQFHPASTAAVHRPDLPAGWSPSPATDAA